MCMRMCECLDDDGPRPITCVVAVDAAEAKMFGTFECPICQHIVWEPLRSSCPLKIKHKGCAACIDRLFQLHVGTEHVNCPMCRAPQLRSDWKPLAVVEPTAAEMLGKLTIFCPSYRDAGCTWKGEYSGAAAHLANACAFATQSCEFCKKTFRKADFAAHEALCQRWETCGTCHKRVVNTELAGHQAQCPEAVLPCPNECGTKWRRKTMPTHLGDCPCQLLPCPLAFATGCPDVRRADMSAHLADEAAHLDTANHTDTTKPLAAGQLILAALAAERRAVALVGATEFPVMLCARGHRMTWRVGLRPDASVRDWRARLDVGSWVRAHDNYGWFPARVIAVDPPAPTPSSTTQASSTSVSQPSSSVARTAEIAQAATQASSTSGSQLSSSVARTAEIAQAATQTASTSVSRPLSAAARTTEIVQAATQAASTSVSQPSSAAARTAEIAQAATQAASTSVSQPLSSAARTAEIAQDMGPGGRPSQVTAPMPVLTPEGLVSWGAPPDVPPIHRDAGPAVDHTDAGPSTVVCTRVGGPANASIDRVMPRAAASPAAAAHRPTLLSYQDMAPSRQGAASTNRGVVPTVALTNQGVGITTASHSLVLPSWNAHQMTVAVPGRYAVEVQYAQAAPAPVPGEAPQWMARHPPIPGGGRVRVTFVGWDSRYDEWMDRDGPRLDYMPQEDDVGVQSPHPSRPSSMRSDEIEYSPAARARPMVNGPRTLTSGGRRVSIRPPPSAALDDGPSHHHPQIMERSWVSPVVGAVLTATNPSMTPRLAFTTSAATASPSDVVEPAPSPRSGSATSLVPTPAPATFRHARGQPAIGLHDVFCACSAFPCARSSDGLRDIRCAHGQPAVGLYDICYACSASRCARSSNNGLDVVARDRARVLVVCGGTVQCRVIV